MKKILFRSYGDENFGMGHVIRSLSLAKYLETNHAAEIYFAIKNKESIPLFSFLKSARVKLVDFEQIKHCAVEYLIYDMPFYDQSFFETVRTLEIKQKMGLDYFFYETDQINIAVNLFNHGNPDGCKFRINEGIQYAILRDNIINKTRTAIRGGNENILFTFGSADPKNNICWVLDQFPDSPININIIIGVLFKHENALRQTLSRFKIANTNIFRNVPNIEDHILSNSLIFCGGGTTLLESIHLHRPCVVISQTSQEYDFAKSLSESGLCHVIARDAVDAVELRKVFQSDIGASICKACQTVDLGLGKRLITAELLGL